MRKGGLMDADFPIMVVDDDVVSRALIERYLKKAGFEVTSAGNGKEAISLLDQQFYPIVLTDWMMPEMDGPELCRNIRDRKMDGYVFIILITARDSKTDIVSGLESGADDYLTKPIHSAELLARINTGIRILKLEQSLLNANKEIRLLSITDPLTGCFNRTYLNERYPQEFSRAQRYKHSLSAVISDIDHFKRINDTYGHQAGDLVLKLVGNCLTMQVREKIDWVVRYGGEEFLIILPETDSFGTRTLSERLRNAISNLEIEYEGQKIQVTASFGGASAKMDNPAISMEQLINQADDQLYQSKREGRNRVNVLELDE
jgi:diguanylate cyclase (GGDEF)-like protein